MKAYWRMNFLMYIRTGVGIFAVLMYFASFCCSQEHKSSMTTAIQN